MSAGGVKGPLVGPVLACTSGRSSSSSAAPGLRRGSSKSCSRINTAVATLAARGDTDRFWSGGGAVCRGGAGKPAAWYDEAAQELLLKRAAATSSDPKTRRRCHESPDGVSLRVAEELRAVASSLLAAAGVGGRGRSGMGNRTQSQRTLSSSSPGEASLTGATSGLYSGEFRAPWGVAGDSTTVAATRSSGGATSSVLPHAACDNVGADARGSLYQELMMPTSRAEAYNLLNALERELRARQSTPGLTTGLSQGASGGGGGGSAPPKSSSASGRANVGESTAAVSLLAGRPSSSTVCSGPPQSSGATSQSPAPLQGATVADTPQYSRERDDHHLLYQLAANACSALTTAAKDANSSSVGGGGSSGKKRHPPLFTIRAHVFYIHPETRRSWVPASTTSGSVAFHFDPARKVYRVISMEGNTQIINVVLTPTMLFTKTSQKFGQLTDSRQDVIYGFGFQSETDVQKFLGMFDELHNEVCGHRRLGMAAAVAYAAYEARRIQQTEEKKKYLQELFNQDYETPIRTDNGRSLLKTERQEQASLFAQVPSQQQQLHLAYEPLQPPTTASVKQRLLQQQPQLKQAVSRQLCTLPPASGTLESCVDSLTGPVYQLVAELQQQSSHSRELGTEAPASVEDVPTGSGGGEAADDTTAAVLLPLSSSSAVPPTAPSRLVGGGGNQLAQTPLEEQLRYENERLRLALIQSSTNARKWEAELQALKDQNSRLTTNLTECKKNLEEWKQKMAALSDENSQLRLRINESGEVHQNNENVCNFADEVRKLRAANQLLETELEARKDEIKTFKGEVRNGLHGEPSMVLQTENEKLRKYVFVLRKTLHDLRKSYDHVSSLHPSMVTGLREISERLGMRVSDILALHQELVELINLPVRHVGFICPPTDPSEVSAAGETVANDAPTQTICSIAPAFARDVACTGLITTTPAATAASSTKATKVNPSASVVAEPPTKSVPPESIPQTKIS